MNLSGKSFIKHVCDLQSSSSLTNHSLVLKRFLHHFNNSKLKYCCNAQYFRLHFICKRNRQYCTKKELKPDVQKLLNNAATFENDVPVGEEDVWATSPYPKGVYNPRLQSNKAFRPKVDPRETSLILFPGEGSQYVGMGKDLLKFPGVKDIFDAANDILKYNLLLLCLQGPKTKLDESKYAQVAVMVCSFAALQRLKEERPTSLESCIATAGFGIGELTALTFAGAVSFERAVRLAQLRGEAMQTASQMGTSGLLTVLYKADTKLHDVLMKAKEYAITQGVEKPVCEVSHYLYPQCKVVAGHEQCLKFIENNYKSLSLSQTRRLTIKGAQHTSLMEPAAQTFRKYLHKSNLQDPVIAVHSNLDGKVYENKVDIFRKLPKQIMKPIKWEQLMHIMYERPVGHHFPTTFECGPGNTLKTLLKLVNAKAYDKCIHVFDGPTTT